MDAGEVLAANGGVVRLREHRRLRSCWWRGVKAGRLVQPLPGVVMDAGLVEDNFAWIRAVSLWNPNAVVAGAAAAALDFDPTLQPAEVAVYFEGPMTDRGPLRFFRAKLDPDLLDWHGDVRVTGPTGTAITAALTGDLSPGTTALRKGLTSPTRIGLAAESWSPRTRNRARDVALDFSRNPWSPAEVDAHRLFREAGIRGWTGNGEIWFGERKFVADILIRRAKIAFEVNSFEFHSSRGAMEQDSSRLNQFLSHGWRSYTLTPGQIRDQREETKAFVRSVVWDRHRGPV